MKKIEKLPDDELYVMLMLQRSEANGAGIDCEDTDVVLACLEDLDNCPAACKADYEDEGETSDEVVKSGSLVVSSSAAEDRSVVVPANDNDPATALTAISDLDTLTFKTSEEVTLSKVVLEKYGFSNGSFDIKGIWLEDEDGNVITTSKTTTPNTKGLVNLSLKKDYKTIDGILNATIVIEMNEATTTPNGTLGFKVSDVTSTAKDVDLGNYKAYTYNVVAYDGSVATVSARWWQKDHNYEAGKSYEVSKFKVKAPEGSAILVKSFVLENRWNLNVHDFLDADSVEVTVAGETVKATASLNKDQELTISLKKDVEIAAKKSVEFIVSAALNSDFDKYSSNVKFAMTNITATDKNGVRITPDCDGNWVQYNFLGGKVRFTNNKLGNVEAAINSDNVLIADGTIELTEALKGTASISLTQPATYPANNIKEIRLVVAGEETVGTIANTNATTTTVNFTNLEISESGKVRVYVDIDDKNQYEGQSITFGSIDWTLQYEEDDNTIPAEVDKSGTISVSKLTLQKPEGSLTNTISSDEVEFKNGSSETKEIFKGTYTAKKSAINLNKFTLTGDWANVGGAYDGKNPMHVYLYIGGTEVADAKLNCTATTCTATDTFNDVLVAAEGSVEVRVEAEVNGTKAMTSPVKFNLVLEGTDENDNPAGIASKQSAKVSVVEQGTPEVEKGTANNTVLVRGKDNTIATMTVKPSGASSSIDLEQVYFDKWTNDCSKIKLIVGNTDKTFAQSGTDNICKVEGLSEEIGTAGKVLSIEFSEEPSESTALITAVVNNLYLNNTKVNGTFSKAYADATISFNQVKQDDMTKFTVANIEKYSTATTISNLHFYDANDNELLINGITPTTELAVNDEFTISNLKSSVYVKKIAYTVKRGTNFTQTVVVDYATYKDFFKTNDGDLRTYAYGDADTNASNSTKVYLTAFEGDTTLGYNGSQLQNGLNISKDGVVGTVNYITGWSSAWWATDWTGNFIAVKVSDDIPLGEHVYIDTPTAWLVDASRIVVLKVDNRTNNVITVTSGAESFTYSIANLVLLNN